MSFITSFVLAILTFGVIFSGPLFISYGSKLPCTPDPVPFLKGFSGHSVQEAKNLINLFGSLMIAVGAIIFSSLLYNTNFFYDSFLYAFVVSGILILNYGIFMICSDQKCDTDRKSILIAGSVITFIALMIVLYLIRKRIIFV